MKKVNEINEKLITALEEKIQLLEEQKAINEKIIEIQKEQLFLSGVSISIARAEKYARMQHFLGETGRDFVEWNDWVQN
jgi:hypothetical protein